jgi:hypothetical protein
MASDRLTTVRLPGSLRRSRAGSGTRVLLALALLAAGAVACTGSSDSAQPPTETSGPFTVPADAAHAPKTRLLPEVVARIEGLSPAAVAVDRYHVVWEPGPLEGEFSTTLVQRDLRSGHMTTLARNVEPLFGLASSTEWVVYVTPSQPQQVVMVRHDGTGRQVIATGPIAPITGRGDLVAWAQEANGNQQVVVMDTRTGHRWLAADMPACVGERCYRIDWVTLSDDGVVFDRGAIGPQPSFVVRRRFAAADSEEMTLPNDPQPDLIPSSSGAFYNWFGHGWYRWDFGSDPVPVDISENVGTPRGFEDGVVFVQHQTARCQFQLLTRSPGGRTVVESDPATVAAPRPQPGDCLQLASIVSTDRQVITGWTLIPRETEQGHSEEELSGLVLASRPFS